MDRLMGALLLTAALAFLMVGCGNSPPTRATIAIRYSQFVTDAITLPAGVPVTITLRNNDPIDHEWIVGPPEVHERHRSGTEPFHDEVPAEVTIPALSARMTTLTFERAGEYAFICHLPGHEAYGMVGRLRVVEP
jgi:uncharacterized cupredoxin-like copper-binding protein